MARRFNYTGRQKILQNDVSVRLIDAPDDLCFAADLRLEDYGFPADAHVHVEAYRGLSALWKRFDFGRVGVREIPSNLSLKEFEHPDGILFRVKVSAAAGEHQGRLFGEADQIHPHLPGEAEQPASHLIGVNQAPLGGELWRVQFPDNDFEMPTLLINKDVADWSSRARDPQFRAVVLPGVMRQALTRILLIDRHVRDVEDAENWRERWLAFAERLPGIAPSPDPLQNGEDLEDRPELTDWIDDAVSAFGVRSGIVKAQLADWNAEEQS